MWYQHHVISWVSVTVKESPGEQLGTEGGVSPSIGV